MHRNRNLAWLALGAICVSAGSAASADRNSPTGYSQSRQDAQDLAALAPLSRASTRYVTYGDAPVVRHVRVNPGTAGQESGADAPVGLYLCPGRKGRTGQEVCVRDPRRVRFREFYVYSPAYATSPQVRRDGLNRETSLLPSATRFFYSANAYLFGNPAGE